MSMRIEVRDLQADPFRTRKGYPAMWVGGGKNTRTCQGRFVLRNGELAPALFVRTGGMLSCENDQALVGLLANDLVVEVNGYPNPDEISISAYRFDGEKLRVINTASFVDIPEKVWEGLRSYHNRSGHYFVQ